MTDFDNLLPPGVYRFTVDEKYHRFPLDQYLAEGCEAFSLSLARQLIGLGGVHLAGRRIRAYCQPVSAGENLEVFVDKQSPVPMKLNADRILYRDQDLIVINKPAGMPSQPAPSRYQGTVYSELQDLLKDPMRNGQRPTIGMVQRLDLDTSGVMVFSIHKRAHKKMTEAFLARNIGKVYLALIAGRPQEDHGKFSSQLAKRRSTNLIVSVERGGKQAETVFQVLQSMDHASLVEVELLTGRSHQIRVHFSEAGLPLLGDIAYGGPGKVGDFNIPRQMLHSRQLSFNHPVTGKQMVFKAPLPDDFVNILTQLDASLNGLDG